MALIPKGDPIKEAMEYGIIEVLPRPYLGYSGLASPCKRYLWLSFRWCYKKQISKQLQRIFDRGNMEEPRIIKDLKAIGCEVFREDENGKHIEIYGHEGEIQEEIVGLAGHVKGHFDGKVLGLPGAAKTKHILEAKTMNDKYFKMLIKNGGNETAIKKVFPTYYGQFNSYMGKSNVKRAIFIPVNKNNEERLYIRVHFDEREFDHLENIAFDILTANIPPKRIGDRTWFECKFCDARHVCHDKDVPPLETCRSCIKACIEDEGKWTCELNGKELSLEDQEKGCLKHNVIVEIKDMLMNKNG